MQATARRHPPASVFGAKPPPSSTRTPLRACSQSSFFSLLALSQVSPLPLPRHDFVLLGCLVAQAAMLAGRFETWDEFKVILVFHTLGLALELFKTQMGSWSYPEPRAGIGPMEADIDRGEVGLGPFQTSRRFGAPSDN